MSNNSSKNAAKLSGGIIGMLIIVVIIAAINIIVSKINLRLDITEDKLYTLSDGTKKILAKIEDPITLKLFFNSSSAATPAYLKTYAEHVEDLLEEYELAGKGKIQIQMIDPKPDSDEEEWAQEYGLRAAQVDILGPSVYFGLVASSANVEAAIPMLDPNREQVLEYNITRMIQRISTPEKPKIGIMSSIPVMGTPSPRFQMPGQPSQGRPPWIAFRELQNDYDVVEIPTSSEKIDPELDALLLVHPKELSEKTLFAIDQFVLGGGKMLAFIDPSSNADRETSMMPQMQFGGSNNSSDLNPLLNAWGVGYDPTKIIADMQCVTPLQGPNGEREESPLWLSLTEQNTRNDIVTSQIDSLLMPIAGVLSDGTDKDLEFTPLIMSSETSSTVPSHMAQIGSQAVKRDFRTSGVKHPLAARLAGKFKTAFPDGVTIDHTSHDHAEGKDGEDEKEAENIPPGLQEGESVVIIVADVDMIYDRYTVREMNFFGATTLQPINENLVFFANALEQVAGSTDLIAVRSRERSTRPFTKVLELESIARTEWQERENELVRKLEDLQARLGELKSSKDNPQHVFLTPEQEQTIRAFEKEQRAISKDLKNVRKNLRKDIETLGMKVKFANILLMPLVISIGGICYGIFRKHKK